jgi:hypothetical protein
MSHSEKFIFFGGRDVKSLKNAVPDHATNSSEYLCRTVASQGT